MTEHKHAAVLRAIADGKEIQYRHPSDEQWSPGDLEDLVLWAADPSLEFRVKPERIRGWINVYDHMCSDLYDTKEAADAGSMDGRIACIPVEFNEGDGL